MCFLLIFKPTSTFLTPISPTGYDANAEAGFELMAETRDQKPVKGLHNDIDMEYVHNGVPLGIKDVKPPLPKVWANLYSSWNLTFCR